MPEALNQLPDVLAIELLLVALALATTLAAAVVASCRTAATRGPAPGARGRPQSPVGAPARGRVDPLTGLGDRGQLLDDLERTIERAWSEDEALLLLLDIDGFAAYGDTFGQRAGEALLVRLGHRLSTAVQPWGETYRLGRDEFCALLQPRGMPPRALAALAAEALAQSGRGSGVSSSVGWARLPAEADDASVALRLADRRMCADKGNGRGDRRSAWHAPAGNRRLARGLA